MPVFVVEQFVSWPSIATLDHGNGHSCQSLCSSDVDHKGSLYVKESVSCGIKHPSVYHAYLRAMQLVERSKDRKCLSSIFSHER